MKAKKTAKTLAPPPDPLELEDVFLALDQVHIEPPWHGDHAFIVHLNGDVFVRQDDEEEVKVGHIEAQWIKLGQALDHGESWFEIMDCHDADLANYLALFDGDHYIEWVEKHMEAAGMDLLILHKIRIEPEHRGHGYGLYAAHLLMHGFGSLGLVALIPAPYELPAGPDGKHNPEWKPAEAKLRKFWSRLGFKQVQKTGIFALSQAQVQPAFENVITSYLNRHAT